MGHTHKFYKILPSLKSIICIFQELGHFPLTFLRLTADIKTLGKICSSPYCMDTHKREGAVLTYINVLQK